MIYKWITIVFIFNKYYNTLLLDKHFTFRYDLQMDDHCLHFQTSFYNTLLLDEHVKHCYILLWSMIEWPLCSFPNKFYVILLLDEHVIHHYDLQMDDYCLHFQTSFITLYFWTSMINIVTFCYDLQLNNHYLYFQTSFMMFYFWRACYTSLQFLMIYK